MKKTKNLTTGAKMRGRSNAKPALRRSAELLTVVLLTLALAACGGEDLEPVSTSLPGTPSSPVSSDLPESLPETSTPPASTASASVVESMPVVEGTNTAPEETLVNTGLISLVGAQNTALAAAYPGQCYAYLSELGAAGLEYYSPYLSFLFVPTDEAISEDFPLNPEGVYPLNPFEEGVYEANPFVGDLTVMQVFLRADYDPTSHSVTNDSSLLLLFNTDSQITYSLLTEKLQQSPPLVHEPTAYYVPITPNDAHSREIGEPIPGGLYTADYDLDGVAAHISFIVDGDETIAISITLGDIRFN